MGDRRLLGMDLGVTSHHVVAVLDGNGQILARRRCRPTADTLAAVEAAALAGAAPGVGLDGAGPW
jgi:hypothetical protein